MTTTDRANAPHVREARRTDLPAIRAIYNHGIGDRIATLDEEAKSEADFEAGSTSAPTGTPRSSPSARAGPSAGRR